MPYEARLSQEELLKFQSLFCRLEISRYITVVTVPDLESRHPEYDGKYAIMLTSRNQRAIPLDNIFDWGPLREQGWHEKFEKI